jgi:hypothetical protein
MNQWNALDDEMKTALYGNDITKMVDEVAEAVASAEEAFNKVDYEKGYMTADMAKGY